MKISQVAIQLYTLRKHTQTPAELAATLKKVREIGYEAVQVSGIGPIEDAELARMRQGEGLVCCSTHTGGADLLADPQKVVAQLNALAAESTAYPFPHVPLTTLAEIRALAAEFDRVGKVLREAGKTLCYHNHHFEFRRIEGKPILEILYDETDPRYLQGEPDTYWIQYGGGDPVAWCRRLKDRMPIIHLKDFAINDANEIIYSEIGNGNLAWPEIIAAAEESGCTWFAVEQDTCPGDEFDSVRQSFEFIRDNLCAG